MSDKQYYNLITEGSGYLNRVKESDDPTKNFITCTIGALRGGGDEKPEYTYLNCICFNEETKELLRKCIPAIGQKKKVFIVFKTNNLTAQPFTYKDGDKKGQPGCDLRAILYKISYIKIDDNVVYKAAKPETKPEEIVLDADVLDADFNSPVSEPMAA